MKGVIYIRVSSDEQVKGTSLEFQEEACRKYCKDQGIEVVNIFREEGASAKDLSLNNRKKFLNALEFSRKNKGKIDAFVVLRVDRFARNTEDHFAIRKILLGYGVSLYSVTEPIGNKPAEKFIETVLAGAAEYDNAIRKQRCSDGMSKKIDQGIYPWKPPIGYKCSHFKKKGEKKTAPDPPDDRIFPIIQKALKEYAKGLYSQSELARFLDRKGLKTILGKKTEPQVVDRILGCYLKFYAGILKNPWTEEEIDGLHKPMITKEELYKIQLVRSGKAKTVKRKRFNPYFLLRRTIMCASCSKPLTGSASRGNGGLYYYYHCYNKKCVITGKGIAKNIIETAFSMYLEKITPKERFLSILKDTISDLWHEKGNHFKLEVKKQEKTLNMLDAKRKRIFGMREDESYTKEEFQERKEEVEKEITATKILLNENHIEQFNIEEALNHAINFILNFGKQWSDFSPQLCSRFQKLVFPEGIPYHQNTGFGTTRLGLIYNLNQQFGDKKSHLVDCAGISWNHIITELKAWQKLQAEIDRD